MTKSQQKSKSKKYSQNQEQSYSQVDSQDVADKQSLNDLQQISHEQEPQKQFSQSQSSSPVEAAIKTMTFRKKRGSKMKDLMKGKIDKDQFWQKNDVYFGGDLRGKDEDQHQSDYQASSSGRDEFDSDFDLTDSYPGKRGRKKGQKIKRKIIRDGTSKPRGRPRKVKAQDEKQLDQNEEKSDNVNAQQRKKKIYKQVPIKDSDVFIIYKQVKSRKKRYNQMKKLRNQQQQQINNQQVNGLE